MTTLETDWFVWWGTNKYSKNSDKNEKFKIIEEITKGQPRYYKWEKFLNKALDCFSKGNIETKEGADKIGLCVKSLYNQYRSIPNIEKYEELTNQNSDYFLFISGFGALLFISFSALSFPLNKKRCSEEKCDFFTFFKNNKFLSFITFACIIAIGVSIGFIVTKAKEWKKFNESNDYKILQELNNDPFWN